MAFIMIQCSLIFFLNEKVEQISGRNLPYEQISFSRNISNLFETSKSFQISNYDFQGSRIIKNFKIGTKLQKIYSNSPSKSLKLSQLKS